MVPKINGPNAKRILSACKTQFIRFQERIGILTRLDRPEGNLRSLSCSLFHIYGIVEFFARYHEENMEVMTFIHTTGLGFCTEIACYKLGNYKR